MHFSYEQIRDDVEGVAAAAKAMNVSRIGCAWIPHKDPFDEEQCRAAAAVFNRAGAALAKHGMQLYYHTHGYEFRPFGQGTIFDLLVAETSPKTLLFEIDVAWVVLPGQDPAELIKKYPDRWLLMHVKDLKKGVPNNHLVKAALTDQVPVGSGQVDWPKVLPRPRRSESSIISSRTNRPPSSNKSPRACGSWNRSTGKSRVSHALHAPLCLSTQQE